MATGKKTKVFDDKATTDDYVDSIIVSVFGFARSLISIKEVDTNAIKYKILATADQYDSDAPWHEIVAETTLAKNGSAAHGCAEAYDAIKIQIKASVGSTQGKVNAWINRKRR